MEYFFACRADKKGTDSLQALMRGICSPENIADFRILIMLQNLGSNFNFG